MREVLDNDDVHAAFLSCQSTTTTTCVCLGRSGSIFTLSHAAIDEKCIDLSICTRKCLYEASFPQKLHLTSTLASFFLPSQSSQLVWERSCFLAPGDSLKSGSGQSRLIQTRPGHSSTWLQADILYNVHIRVLTGSRTVALKIFGPTPCPHLL